jgi:hypothetical protein
MVHNKSAEPGGRPVSRRLPKLLAASCLLLLPAGLFAQIPPLKPPPLQPPSGPGACSVAKSCTDLAPGMVRSALGDSPLEENVRHLMSSTGHRVTDSPAANRAIIWAVAAFRRAGVDEVHTEKFKMPSRAGGPVESENVVAEIRGRDHPDEFVLLGADLDSQRLGADALDDACNAALVIDAARVVSASGSIPRRSIRFVLFTGTEQGLLGSRAYAQAHRAELDAMIAAISFNAGDAPVTGYSLGDRKDAVSPMRDALEPVRTLGVKDFALNAPVSTDNLPFLLQGVLTLTPESSFEAASHTFNKTAVTALKHNVAVAAITAYALADAPERIASRQSPAEIEQLLKETGLGQAMQLEGLWPNSERADQGRQP